MIILFGLSSIIYSTLPTISSHPIYLSILSPTFALPLFLFNSFHHSLPFCSPSLSVCPYPPFLLSLSIPNTILYVFVLSLSLTFPPSLPPSLSLSLPLSPSLSLPHSLSFPPPPPPSFFLPLS